VKLIGGLRWLVLSSLVLRVEAAIAGPGVQLRLEAVSRSAGVVERNLASLETEFGHRRGLIGAHTAEGRFEDGVYGYLIEDYGKAAVTFFTLVESDALANGALARDAEWYLAECLMEDGNTATAVDAYQRIIDMGQSHPFFPDAVRRQLEAYGVLKDSEGFYRVYNQYIVTAIVPTTDEVRYSMGKSFYHQGDWTRAKSLFSEVSGDSQIYTRARYFMGAILVAEGQLESAIPQFERVVQYMPAVKAAGYHGVGGIAEFASMREIESEVVELAHFALARIHYELGKPFDALRYYQAIPTGSDYFHDQLYEMVWVYLKQENWLEAINQIDIFLIAYPEHEYAFQLRLLLGHLHMRREAYERALVTYEKVVEMYGPVRESLGTIVASPTQPDDFFDVLVKGDDASTTELNIPSFAVTMLANDEYVGRAVTVRQELERQLSDLEISRDLIAQIGPILSQGTKAIGTFRAGRSQIGAVRNDSIKLRLDVLDAELFLMEEHEDQVPRDRIVELRQAWDVLSSQVAAIGLGESSQAERLGTYEGQVARVQAEAQQAQRVAIVEMRAVEELKARLEKNQGRMSPEEIADLRGKILDSESRLKQDISDLEQVQGKDTMRRVMSTIEFDDLASDDAERSMISAELEPFRKQVSSLRSRVPSTSAGVFVQLDDAWSRAKRADRKAVSVMGKLERAERTELAMMRSRLANEMEAVVGIGGDLAHTGSSAKKVASVVTRAGVGDVEGRFNETVMGADRGIVDVYWTRKIQITDEIERLGQERSLRSAELDSRFELIRQRMGDTAGGGN
jgi:TolA-binding protein